MGYKIMTPLATLKLSWNVNNWAISQDKKGYICKRPRDDASTRIALWKREEMEGGATVGSRWQHGSVRWRFTAPPTHRPRFFALLKRSATNVHRKWSTYDVTTFVKHAYDLDLTSGVGEWRCIMVYFRERSISNSTLFLGYDMFHLVLLFFIPCYLTWRLKLLSFPCETWKLFLSDFYGFSTLLTLTLRMSWHPINV